MRGERAAAGTEDGVVAHAEVGFTALGAVRQRLTLGLAQPESPLVGGLWS